MSGNRERVSLLVEHEAHATRNTHQSKCETALAAPRLKSPLRWAADSAPVVAGVVRPKSTTTFNLWQCLTDEEIIGKSSVAFMFVNGATVK